MATINILAEVEALKGSRLTSAELTAYQEMREIGYANPYDICDMMREW
jgi:hypothetical protein